MQIREENPNWFRIGFSMDFQIIADGYDPTTNRQPTNQHFLWLIYADLVRIHTVSHMTYTAIHLCHFLFKLANIKCVVAITIHRRYVFGYGDRWPPSKKAGQAIVWAMKNHLGCRFGVVPFWCILMHMIRASGIRSFMIQCWHDWIYIMIHHNMNPHWRFP